MSGVWPCCGARGPVEVERRAERLVRQQGWDDHRPATLPGEHVGLVTRPAEEDAELPVWARDDVRVVDLVVGAVVREALVFERQEEDLEGLSIAGAGLGERNPSLGWEPAMPPADSKLVAAVEQKVCGGDPRGQDGRIVVGEDVDERAEGDPLRPLRAGGKERYRIG